jgi:cytochrome P450
MADGPPVIDFDHHSAAFAADPVGTYRKIQQECPVAWSDAYGGFWVTSRYADVAQVAKDDATFTSTRTPHGGEGTPFIIPKHPGEPQYPIEMDPPESLEYRRVLNPMLSRHAVAAMAPMIEGHVTRVIDGFIERGECDLIHDLTGPVPAAVTLDWLGFPPEDWYRFSEPLHDLFAAVPDSERAERGAEGLGFLYAQCLDLIAQRRAEPADDATSVLVTTPVAGELLDDEKLMSVIFLLIVGGVDTTTSLTGQSLVWLAQNPEERARLAADRSLVPTATEEFLRVFAPSQSMARTVTTDTEVGGCPMKAGDRVLIPWVAANFDDDAFPDATRVVLDRAPNRHASFGLGVHRCVGAPLARAMFAEMLVQVLDRMPDLVVDPDGLVPYPSKGSQTGWDTAPATFTPGPRRGAIA